MKGLLVVLAKELKRVFTDKRLVMNTMILPIFTIAIMYSGFGYFAGNMKKEIENGEMKVVVNYLPESMEKYFDKFFVKIIEKSTDYDSVKEKIYDKEIDGYIVFDEDFDNVVKNYKNGSVPNAKLIFNSKDHKSFLKTGRIRDLISAYKKDVITSRLGSDDFVSVVNYTAEKVELRKNGTERVGGIFGRLLPIMLVMNMFGAAMGLGTDSIAGEKERGTFAIMLIAPIDRVVIIITKIISVSIVAFISTISAFIGLLISIPFSKGFIGGSNLDSAGGNMILTGSQLLMMFLTMIAIMLVSVTLVSVLSLYAQNTKEANSYIAPLYLLITFITFLPVFMPTVNTSLYMFTIPIANGLLCLMKILNGEANMLILATTLISSIVVTGALLYVMRRMIYKESVVFPS